MTIMHTFGIVTEKPLNNFFGFDFGPNVRLGLDYGVTDSWTVGVGRSSREKVVDFRTKFAVLKQTDTGSIPLSITLKGDLGITTVENGLGVIDKKSFLSSAIIARQFNEHLVGQLSPMYAHFNTVFDEGDPNDYLALGVAAQYRFNMRYAVFFESSPAPIYVLFREGESAPVEGQLNIIDVIPGDAGYNDFWQVYKVTVPSNYEANSVTSFADVNEQGYPIEATDMLVNCPVVPKGSTASKRYTSSEETGLIRGWYQGQVVYYFTFQEKMLSTTSAQQVPVSPIYVTFNINPGNEGGGPPSGFVTEMGSVQTHNVPATIPTDADYSPLWIVNIFDNADFDNVMDLTSAKAANILAEGAAIVNCPIVSVTN